MIEPRPDGIGLSDPNLIFYYQNRLVGHGLGYNPADKILRQGEARVSAPVKLKQDAIHVGILGGGPWGAVALRAPRGVRARSPRSTRARHSDESVAAIRVTTKLELLAEGVAHHHGRAVEDGATESRAIWATTSAAPTSSCTGSAACSATS